MDLKKIIKSKRDIKDNSINAYIIALKKLNDNKNILDLNFLRNKSAIKEILDKLKLTTQKNYITAILVALAAVDGDENLIQYYKNLLIKLNEEYTAIMSTNTKSDKQETNWATMSELIAINKKYEKQINNLDIRNRDTLNNKMFNTLQQYVVSSLFTMLPPVRLDYAPLEIIKSKDEIKPGINYLVNSGRNKKYFLIQEFKTSKSIKEIKIDIPTKLNSILNLWLKFNKSKFFLLNNRGGVLSANGLGKMISNVFKLDGRKMTINLLRSIYISENVDVEAVKKSKALASAMGHSVKVQTGIYYKKD